jgi:hypothetical protein
MADWKTVRFDPTYEEKLDPEIIPLCDALNAAGFVTTSSCWGHLNRWPHVWFEHSSEERIESLVRFVLTSEQGDYRPYFSMWQKEVRLDGYAWSVEVHPNNIYAITPRPEAKQQTEEAIAKVAKLVEAWKRQEV